MCVDFLQAVWLFWGLFGFYHVLTSGRKKGKTTYQSAKAHTDTLMYQRWKTTFTIWLLHTKPNYQLLNQSNPGPSRHSLVQYKISSMEQDWDDLDQDCLSVVHLGLIPRHLFQYFLQREIGRKITLSLWIVDNLPIMAAMNDPTMRCIYRITALAKPFQSEYT